jgi:hypothetical protein
MVQMLSNQTRRWFKLTGMRRSGVDEVQNDRFGIVFVEVTNNGR